MGVEGGVWTARGMGGGAGCFVRIVFSVLFGLRIERQHRSVLIITLPKTFLAGFVGALEGGGLGVFFGGDCCCLIVSKSGLGSTLLTLGTALDGEPWIMLDTKEWGKRRWGEGEEGGGVVMGEDKRRARG